MNNINKWTEGQLGHLKAILEDGRCVTHKGNIDWKEAAKHRPNEIAAITTEVGRSKKSVLSKVWVLRNKNKRKPKRTFKGASNAPSPKAQEAGNAPGNRVPIKFCPECGHWLVPHLTAARIAHHE